MKRDDLVTVTLQGTDAMTERNIAAEVLDGLREVREHRASKRTLKTVLNANTINIEAWPLIRGTRRGTRTTNPAIDECIAKLDKAGVWFRLRGSALWQAPEAVSEDGQIAMVLNELADPDHYRYMDHALIVEHLDAKTLITLRNTLANNARLTRAAWRFWTRKCRHDPDAEPGGGPNEGTAQGAWGRGARHHRGRTRRR